MLSLGKCVEQEKYRDKARKESGGKVEAPPWRSWEEHLGAVG